MGASVNAYERISPPQSFIHVDDFSDAEDLANYLLLLSNNKELYNNYFRWKSNGSYTQTRSLNRLCALLHSPYDITRFDLSDWLKKDTCADNLVESI